MAKQLPQSFSDLQPLADEWVRPRQMQRLEKRLSSSYDDIKAFYDVATPRMPAVVEHLSKVQLGSMSEEDRALLDFSFAVAMIAPAVEFFGQPAVVCGFDARKFLPTHEPTSERPAMSIAPQSLI